MSDGNLLNINVNTLFEQHSVSEVDIVHKKIQAVVENKREELRLMVGERYRDLLKAADTIADMQKSAGDLLTQVEFITSACRKLNDQPLLDFNGAPEDSFINRKANKKLNTYFGTMIQIRLLSALPELIWSYIDSENFRTASEIFIFSRHICTGLQLDANNSLLKNLPVAKNQWEILKQFHTTIKYNILTVLEGEELNPEVAVDCLLGLKLLEKTTLNGMIKTFLQLRCKAFLNCLSEEGKNADFHVRRVKERILTSLKILNNTVELIAKCFLDRGLLFQKLSEASDPNALPTIMYIIANDALISNLLPEIISNFKPKYETETLDETEVRTDLEQWLADTGNVVSRHLQKLFNFVTVMSTIQEIKTEAHSFKNNLNMEPIIKKFQMVHSLDFYETSYVPLINQRIHDIIKDSLANALQITFEAIERALPNIKSNSEDIWMDNNTDLPLSLEIALSNNLKKKRILMKSKGYDARTIDICKELDLQFANIISEMNILLEEREAKSEDKLALIVFLRETAETELKGFLKNIKKLNLAQSKHDELLFVVRTCVALVEICPNLKTCFYQRNKWSQWIGNSTIANSMHHWNNFCQILEKETLSLWHYIIDGIAAEIKFSNYFVHNSYNNMLEDISRWETITLEQKDELETELQSTFRVPNQPRISLQSYLFASIGKLISIVPQTLPTQVLNYYNTILLTQILDHYKSLLNETLINCSQNIALQLYFDLKFLQNIFTLSHDKSALNSEFNTLQNTLKEFVDPFDFELLVEHISINVKRSAVRFNCQFGVLVPSTTQIGAVMPISATAHDKEPNVFSLCSSGSTAIWLPLLPIVISSNVAESTPVESKKIAVPEIEKASSSKAHIAMRKSDGSNTSKSKTGASSFFGAMSQDWFR